MRCDGAPFPFSCFLSWLVLLLAARVVCGVGLASWGAVRCVCLFVCVWRSVLGFCARCLRWVSGGVVWLVLSVSLGVVSVSLCLSGLWGRLVLLVLRGCVWGVLCRWAMNPSQCGEDVCQRGGDIAAVCSRVNHRWASDTGSRTGPKAARPQPDAAQARRAIAADAGSSAIRCSWVDGRGLRPASAYCPTLLM